MDITLLKELSLFKGLDLEEIRTLIQESPSRVSSYKTGDIIARQGERVRALTILTRGRIRAQMTGEEQKRLTIDLLEAPELLAPAFIYSTQNTFPVGVEALSDSEVLFLDKEYFLDVMKRYPSVMRAFMREISDRSAFLSQKISLLSLQSLRERLICHLRTHGQIGTQEEMAMLLGVTRPSLGRILSELIDEGIVTKKSGKYLLIDSLVKN
ncbi:MAG: Crp/Fnr family transcriptional regulator [Porphyromonadaceae bacterium]|nr:Crp/Fnr family transcriptional regulator [Porphyromonadaceae bacterium]